MKIGRRIIPKSFILFLVLAIGAGLYLGMRGGDDKTVDPDGDPTIESAKDEAAEQPATTTGGSSTTTTKPGTSTDGGSATTKPAITITALRQSGSAVVLSAMVTGATSGTCTATYERPGAAAVTGTGPVELVTSYYACQVSIPVANFSQMGEWTARAKLGDAVSEPKTVTVQ